MAKWDSEAGLWREEAGAESLFCGHTPPFAASWPAWGSMVRGTSSAGARPSSEEFGAQMLPTPKARDSKDAALGVDNKNRIGDKDSIPRAIRHLLPTPAVNDMGANKTPEQWDEWTARMRERHRNGNGHGKSLSIEAQRMLPTPQARDTKDASLTTAGGHRPGSDDQVPRAVRQLLESGPGAAAAGECRVCSTWMQYADAVHRWEAVIGRPVPPPVVDEGNGPRLNPVLVEWMMGLEEGLVTGSGISRTQQLKMLGNGVVPQQAALALQILDPIPLPQPSLPEFAKAFGVPEETIARGMDALAAALEERQTQQAALPLQILDPVARTGERESPAP